MSDTLLPKVAALEITYNCNHMCLFCSCPWENETEYKDEELSLEEWKNVVDIITANGVLSITLTGGEATTRSDITEIISYIRGKNIQLNIISNGLLIDDYFLDFLAEKNVSICISVPGLDTFYTHTGVDNVQNVLELFSKTHKRGINATANIAVTKKNLPELYENIAYPLLLGADYILLNRFLPGGRGLNNTEYLLSIEEVNQMLDIAEEVLSKANKYGHVGTELPLCVIKTPEKYKHIRVSTMCSAAKGFCIVDPSGYIKVCNHSPQRICKYTEIESLKSNIYWKSFQDRDYLPEMCCNCTLIDRCDGGCREAAHVYCGSINDNDPLFVTKLDSSKYVM